MTEKKAPTSAPSGPAALRKVLMSGASEAQMSMISATPLIASPLLKALIAEMTLLVIAGAALAMPSATSLARLRSSAVAFSSFSIARASV